MRNAIAIWNYGWEAAGLTEWIHTFADYGFDTISFNAKPFAGAERRHLPGVVETLRSRHLMATIHGSVLTEPLLMKTMVEAMGDRLLAFTLDSHKQEDSRGVLHDANRIASALSCLQDLTQGTDIRLAIEDFPLDLLALRHFERDLKNIYAHPRTGILIDVGHMHIKMACSPYFHEMSVSDYFARLPLPLVEVHLHDNDSQKDQHAYFGFGSVPFAEIADTLRVKAFDGVCTLEIAPQFHGRTPLESKDDAVRSLHRWQKLLQSVR